MGGSGEAIRAKVRERYSIAATRRGSCQDDACWASGYSSVELVREPIENLPFPDAHADVVLSNCVINLSPDKPAVFAEAFRILKPGGRLVISDVVQERDLGAIEDDCGCVGNAMVREEYLKTIRTAGFVGLRIVEDRPWRTGPNGIDASAVTLVARKPAQEVST